MEYTELSAYDLPAGIVTTWTPAARSPADTEVTPMWQADPRGISPSHEQHLAQGDTGAWIGGVMRVPAPFVADTLIRALRAWFARHEALRADVVRDDVGTWRRRMIATEAVAVDHHVLGAHTGAEAHRVIAEYFAELSPLVWPHCVFATITEPGADGFTLAFGADHSVMDAYSQLLWFDEIASLYARASAGESDAALAATGSASYLDHAHLERAIGDDLDAAASVVARWRDFLGDEGFPRCPGIDAGPERADEPQVRVPAPRAEMTQASLATWLVDGRTGDVFNQLCKAGGGSLQAGLLAAMAQVLQEQHGNDRLRFVVPMHTRSSLEHATAIGWYVGLCPIDLDLTAHPTLAQLLLHTQAQLGANRDLVAQPFARVMELLELTAGPKFAVSFVDGRFIPGAGSWEAWQARALRSPAYADDEVYLWFGRTRDGLNISARYPGTVAGERMMRDLVTGIVRLIEEVAASVLEREPVTA